MEDQERINNTQCLWIGVNGECLAEGSGAQCDYIDTEEAPFEAETDCNDWTIKQD